MGNASTNYARKVYAARDNVIPHRCVTRHALTSKSNGIKAGRTLDDLCINRDTVAGFDHNNLSQLNLFWGDGDQLSVALNCCAIRANIHKLGNRLLAVIGSKVFKHLSYLEEQHDKDGLIEHRRTVRYKANEQSTNGSDGHEQVLVKALALSDALPCF